LENRLATIFTYLFHPLLIPTYGVCLLYNLFGRFYFISDNRIFFLLLGIIFVSTCLLPVITTFLLFRTGFVTSLALNDRKERLLPYVLTTLYYLFAFYLTRNFPVPSGMGKAIRGFMIGATSALVITGCINLIWKISAHAVALGGLSGALLVLCLKLAYPPVDEFSLCILVTGVVAWARLKLAAHSQSQVYTGFGLGLFCMVFLMIWL
jgi:hypothetical protein